MNLIKRMIISGGAMTIVASPLTAAVTFVFDDFGQALQAGTLVVPAGPTTSTETLTAPNTAGASRSSTLTFGGGLGSVEATVTGGVLDLSADTLTSGTLQVTYNFTPIGATGVNAAINGGNTVEVDLVSSDSPPNTASLQLTMISFGGAMATQSVALSPIGVVQIPFANFAGVNFNQITGMVINWQAGQNFDGQISSVRVSGPPGGGVPEPTLAAGMALLLGATFRRRR